MYLNPVRSLNSLTNPLALPHPSSLCQLIHVLSYIFCTNHIFSLSLSLPLHHSTNYYLKNCLTKIRLVPLIARFALPGVAQCLCVLCPSSHCVLATTISLAHWIEPTAHTHTHQFDYSTLLITSTVCVPHIHPMPHSHIAHPTCLLTAPHCLSVAVVTLSLESTTTITITTTDKFLSISHFLFPRLWAF